MGYPEFSAGMTLTADHLTAMQVHERVLAANFDVGSTTFQNVPDLEFMLNGGIYLVQLCLRWSAETGSDGIAVRWTLPQTLGDNRRTFTTTGSSASSSPTGPENITTLNAGSANLSTAVELSQAGTQSSLRSHMETLRVEGSGVMALQIAQVTASSGNPVRAVASGSTWLTYQRVG